MKRYELSHQKNIRDLGGLIGYNGMRIKYGLLYRGGALIKTNEQDVDIIKSFHLTDVIDFRSEDEFIHLADVRLDGVTYHSFPAIDAKIKKEDRDNDDGNLLWFIDKNTSGYDHMIKQYRGLIKDQKSIDAYKNFFKVLLSDENNVVYYHCSQGKDRAGLASFYIEIALGVDEKVAREDYLSSNVAMKEKVEKLLADAKYTRFYNPEYHQSLLDVFAARIEYIEASIEEMNVFGGPLSYIKNVLEVDIDKLRKKYLEYEN